MYTQNTARHIEESLKPKIAKNLSLNESMLHEVDMDDVMLSEQVWKTLGKVAGTILLRHIPDPSKIPDAIDGILEALSEEAYWSESTGELIFCVEIYGDFHHVQIPAKHWYMKPHCSH
ncbi:MAG: hypothetical protein SVS15_06275 [Thermodesulfobacteriota bacterium]|nr:hypothetical protein [Thermodesulfobacteriota bacterium]